jgi:hypothetical protein
MLGTVRQRAPAYSCHPARPHAEPIQKLDSARNGRGASASAYRVRSASGSPTARQRSSLRTAIDPRWIDACANAISLLLEDGSPTAFAAIPSWLERVPAADRQLDPGLAFNEAVFLARSHRPDQARAQLERVLELTQGDGPLAELADKLLAELAQRIGS